ncbi:hypothetical protein HU718_013615 [Pseudomonas tensinigenes]|jgi:hypothetical protein|uniref:Uncharacterized protein n=1 Tax=Pseudomonas tensinigenes TaxID=2745511 RepID=A0ABX8Q5D9_9PSED|nr:hypothetical protein [Pseudomonas tensinigenes]QXI08691.1 hypothetical protein HU718_013615 [Pseudomonas tensinigenes]
MKSINKKDIEIFGKVLSELGTTLEENPEILLNLLRPYYEKNQKEQKEKEVVREEIQNLNIFEAFKEKKKSEIEKELITMNKEELKYIIKKYSIGATKLTSNEKLSEFIADHVTKRTKDVFINQE